MELYNYVAGGSFPPCMPNGFYEKNFGRMDVVIFALNEDDTHDFYSLNLADKLQRGSKLRGLVYSFSPETRDYLNCAEFFKVQFLPAYVVVSYRDFEEFLCINSYVSIFDRDYRNHLKNYLDYMVINGEIICNRYASDVSNEILDRAFFFFSGGRETEKDITQIFGKIPKETLKNIKLNFIPQKHNTEIMVLIHNRTSRYTKLERLLYSEFIKYGSMTDDVMIRILFPIHVSDEYARTRDKYEIKKLPAVIYKNTIKDGLVLKMERDFLETIPNLTECLPFMISDIHRVISSYHKNIAKDIVKEIWADTYCKTLNIEEIKTVEGIVITHLKPKENSPMPVMYENSNTDTLEKILEEIRKLGNNIDMITFYVKPGVHEDLVLHIGPLTPAYGLEYVLTIPLQGLSSSEIIEELKEISNKKINKLSMLPKNIADIVKRYLIKNNMTDLLNKLC